MAVSIFFYAKRPSEPISQIRFEVRYTLNSLPFAANKKFGGLEIRFSGTVSPWNIKPSDLVAQRLKPKASNAKMINQQLETISERVVTLHARFVAKNHFPDKERFRVMVLTGEQEVVLERKVLADFQTWNTHLEVRNVSKAFQTDCRITLNRLTTFFKVQRLPEGYESVSTPMLAAFEQFLWAQPKIKAQNTVAKYMNRFVQFLNFALSEKWTVNDIHKKYKISEFRNPFPVALTEAEVEAIWKVDLTPIPARKRKTAEKIRDQFVLATQTGIRFGDWKKAAIVKVPAGWNLRLSQSKTEHPVEIPLSRLAVEVLEKYGFAMPSTLAASTTLKHLAEIARLAGVTKEVKTHTARRTCATLLEKAGVPRSYIMRITGHKTEDNYLRYVGITHAVNADLIRKAFPEKFAAADAAAA